MNEINKELKEIELASSRDLHLEEVELSKANSSANMSPFSAEKLKEIEKEMTISELVDADPELAEKLTEMGFGCVGCSCSSFETLEQGIAGHGMDPEAVIEELNKNRKGKK